MTITILAVGTRGDTEPYVALGVALQQIGYRIRLASFENYRAYVESYGLEFFPVKGDVTQVLNTSVAKHARNADNPLKVLLSFREMKKLVYDAQFDLYDACTDAEAIIYHPGAMIGHYLAKKFGVPGILATPFPMKPTRDYPALIFYKGPRMGGWWNEFTHRLFEKIMWSMSSGPIIQFWKAKFGSEPIVFHNPFLYQQQAEMPTIISCSSSIFPRSPKWNDAVHQLGYWFLDEDPNWQPPEELNIFLKNGPAPVYVGFGSVGDPTEAVQTTKLIINALQLAGQRGVIATGWAGLQESIAVPEGIYLLDHIPHAWLFPRMAVVVHHGGAGTSAAGFRAGIPCVIIPHANDQFAWAKRAEELGVAGPSIPRKRLRATKLAASIQAALHPTVVSAAAKLGEQIRRENGAVFAAEIIQRTLRNNYL